MPKKKAAPKRTRKMVANNSKLIGYVRVSTQKQGKSGLGMESQDAAISAYAARHGGKVIARYVEVESGKRSDRPELAKALAHARRSGARLVVAKLDRLARNLHFLSSVMESGVDFCAIDNEYANRLTLHVLAAVAEAEAAAISQRTKDALQAYKARGGVLGTPANLTHKARVRGAKAAAASHKERADQAYTDLLPQMQAWREDGTPLATIAQRLNDMGHSTRRGKQWSHIQVQRVLERSKPK